MNLYPAEKPFQARRSFPGHDVHKTVIYRYITLMSLLEAPYLIEAPPNGSASYHKILALPQNRSARRL